MAQAKTVGREVAANVVKETAGLTGESRDASKSGFSGKALKRRATQNC